MFHRVSHRLSSVALPPVGQSPKRRSVSATLKAPATASRACCSE